MLAIHFIGMLLFCCALGLLIFFFIVKPLISPINRYFSLKKDDAMREGVRRSLSECIERQNKALIDRASLIAGIK